MTDEENNISTASSVSNVSDVLVPDDFKSNSCSISTNFDNAIVHYNTLSFMFTNARSLPPKIGLLVEMFDELELYFPAISETWFSSGRTFKKNVRKMEDKGNLILINKNRPTRGGGVAIAFNSRKMSLKYAPINRNSYEVVAAIGRTCTDSRMILVLLAYYATQMTKASVDSMNMCISNCINDYKSEDEGLVTIICGDMNKKDVNQIMLDHPEIMVVDTPNTRGNEALDLCLTNLPRDCFVRQYEPLAAPEGRVSDHNCIVVVSKTEKKQVFKKKVIKFRPFDTESEAAFGHALAAIDWAPLYYLSADNTALQLHETLWSIYIDSFPEKTRIIKSTDKPWFNKQIKRLIEEKVVQKEW